MLRIFALRALRVSKSFQLLAEKSSERRPGLGVRTQWNLTSGGPAGARSLALSLTLWKGLLLLGGYIYECRTFCIWWWSLFFSTGRVGGLGKLKGCEQEVQFSLSVLVQCFKMEESKYHQSPPRGKDAEGIEPKHHKHLYTLKEDQNTFS